ncbi:hypothetical protein UMZ34_05430 [Halopseudomonas pachastrellae]|nr:hypothetical protein UMZ34_05430 [Halopseudomonas pachastrellae]
MSVTLGLPGVADNISLRGFGAGGARWRHRLCCRWYSAQRGHVARRCYGDLNVIIPLELERIDVLRGPVSALYGNYNRAGTVTLQSRRGGNYRDLDVSAAEFGKLDLQAAGGVETERQRFNLAVRRSMMMVFAISRRLSARLWPGAGAGCEP